MTAVYSNNSTMNVSVNTTELGVTEQDSAWPSDEILQAQNILVITLICVGVAAIIPNLLFILSLTQVRDRDSAFHRFMKSLSVSDVLGSLTFIVIMNCPPGFGEIDKDNFQFIRYVLHVNFNLILIDNIVVRKYWYYFLKELDRN